MTLKLSRVLMASFMSLFVYHAAQASQSDAVVDIIHTIQIEEELSLNSTADEIEAFIATKPSLKCKRIDVPERKSKHTARLSSPRQQNWTCMYSHKTLGSVAKFNQA